MLRSVILIAFGVAAVAGFWGRRWGNPRNGNPVMLRSEYIDYEWSSSTFADIFDP